MRFKRFRLVGDRPDGTSSLPSPMTVGGYTLQMTVDFFNHKDLVDRSIFMFRPSRAPWPYSEQEDPLFVTHVVISNFMWYQITSISSLEKATTPPSAPITLYVDPPDPAIEGVPFVSKQIVLPTDITVPDFIVPLVVASVPTSFHPVDGFVDKLLTGRLLIKEEQPEPVEGVTT